MKALFVKRSPRIKIGELAEPKFFSLASAFYRIGYKLHHKFSLRPQPPLHVPVIIVGSYLVGGAGKTPFTIWLAKRFQEQNKQVAVLCHSAAWDEFIMLQNELAQDSRHFPSHRHSTEIKVIATKNRYRTAKQIQDKFDIILCDDGFEDSRFTGAVRICLDWQSPPTSWKTLWPNGPFRSLKQDHDENEVIHIDCYGKNGSTPDIRFFIESLTNYTPAQHITATVTCGLGSPRRFIEDVRSFGVNIEKTIIRPDHDRRFAQVVKAELSQDRDVVISQKDACRLPQELQTHPKLHIAIQKIDISKPFADIIPI